MIAKTKINSEAIMATPEKLIENSILDNLNIIPECFAFKVNTTGVYDPRKRVFRKNNNPHIHNGTSDILGTYKGRFFAIEVKAGYAKPSDKQKLFLKRIEQNGGIAFWANSLDLALEKFKEAFPCANIPKTIF